MAKHDWVPGRWYRILQPDGSLWMETSDREEVLQEAEAKGWPVFQQWRCETTKWRPIEAVGTPSDAAKEASR